MGMAKFHWQLHHSDKAYLPSCCFGIRKWASGWHLWIIPVNGGTPMHEDSDFDLSYLTLSSTYKDLEQLFLKMQLLGCALLPFVVT